MGDTAKLLAQLNAQLAANNAIKDEWWNALLQLNSVQQEDVVTHQNKIDQLNEQIKANNKNIDELIQRIKNPPPVTVITQHGPANDILSAEKVHKVQSSESIISESKVHEVQSPEILESIVQ